MEPWRGEEITSPNGVTRHETQALVSNWSCALELCSVVGSGLSHPPKPRGLTLYLLAIRVSRGLYACLPRASAHGTAFVSFTAGHSVEGEGCARIALPWNAADYCRSTPTPSTTNLY